MHEHPVDPATAPHLDRRLFGIVVLVGCIGGAIGAAYVTVLRALEAVLGPDQHTDSATRIALLVAVGLAIGLLTRGLGDPGDVELLVDNIHIAGGAPDARPLRALIPVSLLGIAAGSAIGPEAPLVQTAGIAGTAVGRWRRLRQSDVRVLTICGMASAFAVLFGAPVGSAIFALEILHRRGLEYYEALLPALGGALVGYTVFVAFDGIGVRPIFDLPTYESLALADLGWGVVAGVIGAAIASVFAVVIRGLRQTVRRIPAMLRPGVGGLIIGGLSVWSFAALTFGETQLDVVVAGTLTAGAIGAALAAKLVASAVCATTGWRGGFIIPLFFMGACAGQLLSLAVPSATPVVLIASCMVAANVGVTKTPLGSILVVASMAGMPVIPPLAVAALVSLILTREFGVITSQRTRDVAGLGVGV